MIHTLQFVILALAVFRVTRLLIEDSILEPIRELTTFRLSPQNKFRELIECPWCLGMWLSFATAGLVLLRPVIITWLALPFALSAVVGLIAEHSE